MGEKRSSCHWGDEGIIYLSKHGRVLQKGYTYSAPDIQEDLPSSSLSSGCPTAAVDRVAESVDYGVLS